MSRVGALGRFLYDLIVGDDWRVRAGVVVAGGVTALLAAQGLQVWWLPPLAVLGILGLSLRRATRG